MVGVVAWVDSLSRELMTFAAVMLLIGGIDDLLVDLVYLARRWRYGPPTGFRLEPPAEQGRIAIFVAAWQEADVIGRMLSSALSRLKHQNFRIYLGCYPNDPATIDAAAAVAERDPRLRLVIGDRAGPTTKADNLNTLWHALLRADADEGQATRAVVLHDAEDQLHPEEIGVYDALIVTGQSTGNQGPRGIEWDLMGHGGLKTAGKCTSAPTAPLHGGFCQLRRSASQFGAALRWRY